MTRAETLLPCDTAPVTGAERCVRLGVDPVFGWAPVLALTAAAPAPLEATADHWLSRADARQVAGYATKRRRHDVLLGRRAAYLAVAGQFPAVPPCDYRIENGVFGQPIWAGHGTKALTLSISHAQGLAAAVAAPDGFPMGIDIEQVSGRHHETLKKQMTGAELALAATALPAHTQVALALLWCAKEALSKALRCGLTCPMQVLEIDTLDPVAADLMPDGRAGWTGTFANFYQYRFHAWCPQPGHMLAFVMDRRCRLATVNGGGT